MFRDSIKHLLATNSWRYHHIYQVGHWTTFETLVFTFFFSDLRNQPIQKLFSFLGVKGVFFPSLCRLACPSQLLQNISHVFEIRLNASDFNPDSRVKPNATDPIQKLDALGQTLVCCLKLAQRACRLK